MRELSRVPVGTLVATVSLVLAGTGLAAAQAPTDTTPQTTPPAGPASVTYDRSCYAPGDTITETGTGFSLGGHVLEAVGLVGGGGVLTNLTADHVADATGTYTARLRAPNLVRSSDRTETALVAFSDLAAPSSTGPTATAQWTLSAFKTRVAGWIGGHADPKRSMTIDTLGWTSTGTTLYLHYYRGSTHVKSVKVGALTGDCGDLHKTVKQFPFAHVKAGQWTIYFSTTAVLNRQHDVFMKAVVTVPKSKATD